MRKQANPFLICASVKVARGDGRRGPERMRLALQRENTLERLKSPRPVQCHGKVRSASPTGEENV